MAPTNHVLLYFLFLLEFYSPGADPPLQIKDDTPWCPIRVCALSYEPSHACPRDDYGATHKCETITTNREVWKCTNAEPPVIIALPVGCDEVGSTVSCVETVKACDCKAETKDVIEYRPQFPYHPICSSDGDIIG